MAAYLSMAAFIPIGIPIFVNHQARLAPTTVSARSSDQHLSTKTRVKDQQAVAEERFFSKAKMSIFASQPLTAASVPPPSYSSTRHQPPPYAPKLPSARTSSSNTKTWFGSFFGGKDKSQSSLRSGPAAASEPELNLTPLPLTYDPISAPPSLNLSTHPSASTHSLNTLATLTTIPTTSSVSISTTTTREAITTQQPSSPHDLPKYEAIQTPSSKSLTRTQTRSTATTSNSSSSQSRAVTENRKPTWSNPFPATVDLDPHEEYELRQRAEREREVESGDWCCGCFWVGPAHPWQAYYVF